jgi:predicted transcriptional regulator
LAGKLIDMKVGSIASNPNKLRIMNLLLKKDMPVKSIAKAVRMPEVALKTLLNELVKDGFVEEKEGVYRITSEGEKALKSLK